MALGRCRTGSPLVLCTPTVHTAHDPTHDEELDLVRPSGELLLEVRGAGDSLGGRYVQKNRNPPIGYARFVMETYLELQQLTKGSQLLLQLLLGAVLVEPSLEYPLNDVPTRRIMQTERESDYTFDPQSCGDEIVHVGALDVFLHLEDGSILFKYREDEGSDLRVLFL